MPYIPAADRFRLAKGGGALTMGELNFQLTRIVMDYLRASGRCYATMNDIVGALECAKAEFIRRVVAPYEDAKCAEHGDVY